MSNTSLPEEALIKYLEDNINSFRGTLSDTIKNGIILHIKTIAENTPSELILHILFTATQYLQDVGISESNITLFENIFNGTIGEISNQELLLRRTETTQIS